MLRGCTGRAGLAGMLVAVGLACSPSNRGSRDTFVTGSSQSVTIVRTSDARIEVPLAAGLAWEPPVLDQGALLKVRAKEGPTYVVVAAIDGAPTPLALGTCAEAHRAKIATSLVASGVRSTPPLLDDEIRKGARVPRLHYAVPLEAKGDAPPAATFSWWTYVLDRDRCVGIGVTTLVRAKQGEADAPDPEDLTRLDRVFSLVAEGTAIAK